MTRPGSKRQRIATTTAVLASAVTAATMIGASPAQASGEIRVAAGAQPVAGNYIVVMKNADRSPAKVQRQAEQLADRKGAEVTRVYSEVMDGFAMKASREEAAAVAADPKVAYVEQDAIMRAADTQSNATWGLDRIDQRSRTRNGTYVYGGTGAGASVYVIDSGIRTSHSDFGGRAKAVFDSIRDGRNGQDCNGHGTHVAGTVGGAKYGVAKQANLYAVRVLDCDGSGKTSGVIAGVDWVTANAAKPAVANMSLGGSTSTALDAAVRRSINAGITYALAAGNENVNACNVSPARTAEAITVGATTSTDARASFSNYGSCLDLFAPGDKITSAAHGGDTRTATMSGTSMASPHVAGVAALYVAANRTATPAQVRSALVGGATGGVVGSAGSGSPTGLLYSRIALTAPATTQPAPKPAQTAKPAPAQPAPTSFANTSNMSITSAAKLSGIRVTGLTGRAPSDLKVTIRAKFPNRGGLKMDLIRPDGRVARLKTVNLTDRRVDFAGTYTLNASAGPAAGLWKLRISGVALSGGSGYLDSWSLRF